MNRLVFEDELKGNLNWNDDITLLFVNIYLKQECLWNQLHPDNKIMFRRKKAHYDMISEFKSAAGISLSLCDVKKKIQSLRNSYLTQVKKMLSTDSMYDPVVFSNWFHEMDRCLKTVPGHYGAQYTQRQPKLGSSHKMWSEMQSNNAENIMTVQRPPEVGSSHQTWSELPTEDIKMVQRPPEVDSSFQILGEVKSENSEDINTAQDPPELDSSHEMWVELQSDDSEDISNEHLMQPTDNITQRESVIKIENHQSSSQDPTTQSEESSKVVIKADEFDMYGKFVASQLKKLSLDKALRLQLQIQNIVCQARLSDLSS